MRRPATLFAAGLAAWACLQPAVAITCPPPGQTAGISPQEISVCSQLFASLTAQRATQTTGAVSAVITFTPTPTGTRTSRSSSEKFNSPTTIATTTTSLPRSTNPAETSSSLPGTQTQTQEQSASASAAAGPGPSKSHNDSNDDYRDHVVIPAAVVGSVAGAAIVAALIWFCVARRRKQRDATSRSSLEAGAGFAGAEKTSPTTGDSNGDESPILPSKFANGNAAAQQPGYYPPHARYNNTNATPRGATPEIPPYPIERSANSPTPSDTTPPWRVQPLRHFRRFSDPPSVEATESNGGPADAMLPTLNGLSALQEEDDGEHSSIYATPAGPAGRSWGELNSSTNNGNNNERNRGLWSSWLSSSSGVSGPSDGRPVTEDTEPMPTYPPRSDSHAIGTAL